MGVVHVNTDQMRELSKRFMECNNYIQNHLIPDLHHLSVQMESDWIGVSRAQYDELFQHWMQSALNLEHWGENISQHVSQTAEQFDKADSSL